MTEPRSARLGRQASHPNLSSTYSHGQVRPASTQLGGNARVQMNGNSAGDWSARFLPRIRPLHKTQDDFNPKTELDFTPRAREAMQRLGYKPRDLLPRQPGEFKAPNEKMALLRYNFFENQRRGSLLDIRRVRSKLMRQGWQSNGMPSVRQLRQEIEKQNALLTHRSNRIRKKLLSHKVQSEVSDIYKEQLAAKQQAEAAAALRRRDAKIRESRNKIKKRNEEVTNRFRENWEVAEQEKKVKHKSLLSKIECDIVKQQQLVEKRLRDAQQNRGGNAEKRIEVTRRLRQKQMQRKQWEQTQLKTQEAKLEDSERRLRNQRDQMVFAYKQKLMSRRQRAEENLGKRSDNTSQMIEKLRGKEKESQIRLRKVEADRKRKVERARKAEQYRKDKIRDLRQKQLADKQAHVKELQEKHQRQEETKRLIEQQKQEERMLKNELNRLKDQRRQQLARKKARARTYMADLHQKRIDSEQEKMATIRRAKARAAQQRRDYNTRSQLLREEVTEKLSHAPMNILDPAKMSKFLGKELLETIEDPLSPIKKTEKEE